MSIFGTQSDTDFAAEVAKVAEAEVKPAEAAPPAPEPALEPEASAPQAEADAPQAPAAATAEPKEKEPDKFVPIAALHAEREERKKREQDFQNLMEAFKGLQQQIQAPPQEEQAFDPLDADPSTDPFTVIQGLQQKLRQFEDGARQASEVEQVKTAYLGTIRQAVTTDSSFQDAYNYLVQSRLGELTAMGMNPLAANETIKAEELHLARTSFMNGRNPAEVILGYAKARGYAPKSKQPDPPPPAEQVQKLNEKAAAATSISAGGKPPQNDMSIADMANLKGAAFDAAWDKLAKTAGHSSSLFRN